MLQLIRRLDTRRRRTYAPVTKMKLTLFFVFVVSVHAGNDCLHREYGHGGSVCVCSAAHCDFIGPLVKPQPGEFLSYTSNLAGLRFERKVGKFEQNVVEANVAIDRSVKLQKIIGFGGAFTDATGININSLDAKTRELLMRSYFSEDGLEYNLCRVPIGGTHFSTHSYSYDDGDEDINLQNFKLAPEDHDYKIPFIKTARNMTKNNLKLFASAYTAPKWMKTDGQHAHRGPIKPDMYQSWANYFVKFLDAYEKEDIDFWGITTGNDPGNSLNFLDKINSVVWTSDDMSKWISQNLGPSLRNSTHVSTQLIILADQRLHLPWFVSKVLENDVTRTYVDGIALHWFWDFLISAETLTKTHNAFPGKFLIATEACIGDKLADLGVKLGSWKRAEKYTSDIIEDLQNWVTGWVDWNMALDETGGPTYINSNVDSLIIVNATSGEFYKQPVFYAMGHFSKFLPRDSVHLGISNAQNASIVAFERPDNGTVLVILNNKNEEMALALSDETKGTINLKISSRSISTIIYW